MIFVVVEIVDTYGRLGSTVPFFLKFCSQPLGAYNHQTKIFINSGKFYEAVVNLLNNNKNKPLVIKNIYSNINELYTCIKKV